MAIRVKVIISIYCGSEVLLSEAVDPLTGSRYVIPVGGGVEFGESLYEAAQRELAEEVGLDNVPLEFAGFHESRFVFNGVPEHEIMFHYRCVITPAMRAELPQHATESDGTSLSLHWFSRTSLEQVRDTLVPTGIFSELTAGLRQE